VPTYKYTGDVPTVFITLQDSNGETWVPSFGDQIVSDTEISHPLLAPVSVTTKKQEPEKVESPETVDESEEN